MVRVCPLLCVLLDDTQRTMGSLCHKIWILMRFSDQGIEGLNALMCRVTVQTGEAAFVLRLLGLFYSVALCLIMQVKFSNLASHQWFSLRLPLPVIPFCSVWYLFSSSHLSLSQPVLNLCSVLTVEKESKPGYTLQLDTDSFFF